MADDVRPLQRDHLVLAVVRLAVVLLVVESEKVEIFVSAIEAVVDVRESVAAEVDRSVGGVVDLREATKPASFKVSCGSQSDLFGVLLGRGPQKNWR